MALARPSEHEPPPGHLLTGPQQLQVWDLQEAAVGMVQTNDFPSQPLLRLFVRL